ncbi:MAG: esterase FrsA [Aeromonas sp.]
MNQNDDINLTARLFSPTRQVVETSTIANHSDVTATPDLDDVPYMDGTMNGHWYRLLRRPSWIWQGADPLEVDAVLARIAMSEGPRSHPAFFDTIAGYVPGNWSYEWSQLAGDYFKHGRAELANDPAQAALGTHSAAFKALAKAARYYSIASYPHLNHDPLADQAQLLGNLAYREAGKLLPVPLKEISVPFRGKSIQGYIHLPTDAKAVPLVLVSGGIDSLQLDFLNFYLTRLAPLGIGMLSLDMPGIGYSAHWPLVQDTSRLHQAVLDYVQDLPWIDNTRIGMVGMRLAGNVAARLAFLAPRQLKAVVCMGAGVNRVFTDAALFDKFPRMMRDSLANRLGEQADDWPRLRPKCQVFSLKTQGLLGSRTPVPLLSIGHKRDFICPEADLMALANASHQGRALIFDKEPLLEVYAQAMDATTAWLKRYLCP